MMTVAGGREPNRRPMSRLRAAIVASVTASAQIPQFTVECDARVDTLTQMRKSSLSGFSLTDAIVSATGRALRRHPSVNASFDGDAILEIDQVGIALAVAVPDGIIAPVIRRPESLTMKELRAERIRLTEAAQNGNLRPKDLISATFTISNLGPFGVRRFQALVTPPQAAILAVGAVTDELRISLSLSCDHRAVNGAPAAAFLGDIVSQLEEPAWLGRLV